MEDIKCRNPSNLFGLFSWLINKATLEHFQKEIKANKETHKRFNKKSESNQDNDVSWSLINVQWL